VNLKKLALIATGLGGVALLCGILFIYSARPPANPCANFVPKSQWDICFVPGESDASKSERQLFAALGFLGIGGGIGLIVVGGVLFFLARR
jgi:hypothetical protein